MQDANTGLEPNPLKGNLLSTTVPVSEASGAVLNEKQAATFCGISWRYLQDLRLKGGGPPFIQIGRRIGYQKLDLLTWLDTHKRRSTSDERAA
jgi:hypothetical protein